MLEFCEWKSIDDVEALSKSGLFKDYAFEQAFLPFYKSIILIRCKPKQEKEQYLYYLLYKNMALELSGPSENIHEANDLDGVFINKDNVIQYTKFFSYFIKADGANFPIIESIDDQELNPIKEKLSQEMLSKISKVEYLGYNEQLRHVVSGVVRYKNSLFRAKYEIETDGHVQMIDEESIYEEET
jgi:hypothetical protein